MGLVLASDAPARVTAHLQVVVDYAIICAGIYSQPYIPDYEVGTEGGVEQGWLDSKTRLLLGHMRASGGGGLRARCCGPLRTVP